MLTVSVLIGVAGNWLVYPIEAGSELEPISVWRDLSLAAGQETGNSRLLGELLGVADQQQEISQEINQTDASALPGIVVNGASYRVAGLVVGSHPSVTLLTSEGEVKRILPGGTLPGGETLVEIDLNRIVFRDADGETTSAKIY